MDRQSVLQSPWKQKDDIHLGESCRRRWQLHRLTINATMCIYRTISSLFKTCSGLVPCGWQTCWTCKTSCLRSLIQVGPEHRIYKGIKMHIQVKRCKQSHIDLKSIILNHKIHSFMSLWLGKWAYKIEERNTPIGVLAGIWNQASHLLFQ
jgi:hypothetical protein